MKISKASGIRRQTLTNEIFQGNLPPSSDAMSEIENISRRAFIKYSATAGMSALVHPGSRGQNAAGSPAGRIDVHHHCRTDIQGGGRGGPGADWSPAKSLEQMEKFGISTAIISATVPADPFYDGTERSRSIARGVNE